MLDCLILGGGPAGLSAARWCDTLGMSYVVWECEPHVGGQLRAARHLISDYAGVQLEGPALAEAMGERVLVEQRALLDFPAARALAHTVIVALGGRPRVLPFEQDAPWEPQPPVAAAADAQVVVVGGGDNAVDAANAAGAQGARVRLFVRGPSLRARRRLQSAEVFYNCEVLGRTQGTVITSLGEFPCDVFIRRIGYVPNSEGVRAHVHCDARGFVLIDQTMQTSLPGVFACGDVATPPERQTLAGAVGQGACAARSAYIAVSAQRG